jgi:hypothetical protein
MDQKIIETIESIATLTKQLSESDSSQGLQLLPELVNSLANLITATGPSVIKIDCKKFAQSLESYESKHQGSKRIWDETREKLNTNDNHEYKIKELRATITQLGKEVAALHTTTQFPDWCEFKIGISELEGKPFDLEYWIDRTAPSTGDDSNDED